MQNGHGMTEQDKVYTDTYLFKKALAPHLSLQPRGAPSTRAQETSTLLV